MGFRAHGVGLTDREQLGYLVGARAPTRSPSGVCHDHGGRVMAIPRVLVWVMSYIGGFLLVHGVSQGSPVLSAIGAACIVGGFWISWARR